MILQQKRPRRKIILIVVSNGALALLLTSILAQKTPSHTLVISTGHQAITVLSTVIPDLLVFHHDLVDMSGLELYEQIQIVEKLRPLPFIMLGANTTQYGPRFVYLGTPFDHDVFLHAVDTLLAD
jgi:CheY-like chemotaxis protein